MKQVFRLCCYAVFILSAGVVTAQSVSYSALYDNTSFARTIDLSRPVGVLEGSASTTTIGGALYTIPIKCPPGTNGLQPALSVSYNSHSGNGCLGNGWGLSGLSVIKRSGKDVYHNRGAVAPVTMTNEDNFFLDGSLLYPENPGNNGNNAAGYTTEQRDYSRVISYGTMPGGGPEKFRVITKEGSMLEYGYTADSRVLTSSGTAVMMWLLNRVTDPNGNYMDFVYDNSGNESRILKILYTGNDDAGLAPYAVIDFSYEIRSDQNVVYESTNLIRSKYLLTQISIQTESESFKAYRFNYGKDLIGASFLKSIEEFAGLGGAKLNDTRFKYGTDGTAVQEDATATTIGLSDLLHSVPVAGDFNGDGISDLLITNKAVEGGATYNTGFSIKRRTASSNTWTTTASVSFPEGIAKVENNYMALNNYSSSDFNGDGKDDIVVSKSHYETPTLRYLDSVVIYCPDASGSVAAEPTYVYKPFGLFRTIDSKQNYFYIGDFNGDGYADFLTVMGTYIYFNSPGIGVTAQAVQYPVSAATADFIKAADQVIVMNMDGDAKNELLAIKGNMTRIFTINKEVYTYNIEQVGADLAFPTKNNEVHCGDFNGDGKTDLLVGPKHGILSTDPRSRYWNLCYSDGIKFIADVFDFGFVVDDYQGERGDLMRDRLLIADYNGDGKSDILDVHYLPDALTPDAVYNVYYSRGVQFERRTSPLSYRPIFDGFFVNGDYNGDAKSDVYFCAGNLYTDPDKEVFSSFDPLGQGRLLQKVNDGMNNTTTFQYQPITQGSGAGTIYTKGSGEVYPVNNSQLPVYVVSNVVVPDGVGSVNATTYRYENLRVHRAGKGILGFEKVTALNSNADLRTETTYGLNNAVWIPYEQTVKTYLNSTGALINQVDHSRTFTVFNTGIYTYGYYRQLLEQTISRNFLDGSTETTVNTYNAYDNLVSSVNTLTGGPETFSTTVNYTYVATSAASGIPVKPSEIITINQRGAQPSIGSRTTYAYTAKGNVSNTSTATYPSVAAALTKSDYYTYDECGNKTSVETRSAAGVIAAALWPKTYFYYDDKKRFVVSVKNPAGHNTYTSVSKFWGKALSETGVNGLVTTYTYDDWGRVLSATIPTSVSTAYTVNYSYNWDVAANHLYYVQVSDPSAPDVRTWYDGSGREVRRQAEAFDGNWTSAYTTYDEKGNVKSSTNNYLSGESPVITSRTYDAFDRISTETNIFGTTNYTYTTAGGLSTITVIAPDGKVTSTTKDLSGKLVRSSNGIAGVVHYKYDSRGNEIATSLGTSDMAYQSLITKEYDGMGNLVKLKDPDAGTYTYTYNAFGQMTGKTDPAGQTTTYQYDLMGRLSQKTLAGFITDYEYHNQTKDYRLRKARVTLPSAVFTVEDNYDYAIGSGLIYHSHKSLATPPFVKQFSYDAYGKLSTTEYVNSGFRTRHHYNGNGFLLRITTDFAGGGAGDRVLYQAEAKNGNGQLTAFRRVDHLPGVINYYYGYATGYYTPGVQDLIMDYNYANGNLNYRWDNSTATKEVFSYDAVDRLVHAQAEKLLIPGGGPGIAHAPMDMTYDNNFWGSYGRIMSKSDAGSYEYRGFPRNGVKSITDPANLVSHETQHITYAPFDKATLIQEQVGGIAYEQSYLYNAEEERCYGVQQQDGIITRQRWYMGDYEVDRDVPANTTRHIHYVYGDAGLCGIVVATGGSFSYYAAYTDHLGSIVTVTDEAGAVVAKQSFDAWGRERNPDTWGYEASAGSARPGWLYRGYTGHEMLPEFGLINMNGRMYDPLNGRMMRPDNFVQEPWNAQSYNRYSYCLNNPMKYTDPSGELFLADDLVFGLIGGGMNLVSNWSNIRSVGQGIGFFGIGFAGGAVASYITPVGAAALVGAGNAALNGYIKDGKIDGGTVLLEGIKGGVFSLVTMNLAGTIGPGIAKLFPNIASPVLKNALIQGTIGASIGAGFGGAAAMASGGDVLGSMGMGLAQGFASGFVSGGVTGRRQALDQDINPWTGRTTQRPLTPEIAPLTPRGMDWGPDERMVPLKLFGEPDAPIAAKGGMSVLNAGDALRIENAATRIGKPITVVGSRAKGTAGAFSDWDYVIEGLNNKGWKQIKNSLPGSKSILDNTPRNIDIFKTLDPTKPHITIYPR